jgi:hypothetical protein
MSRGHVPLPHLQIQSWRQAPGASIDLTGGLPEFNPEMVPPLPCRAPEEVSGNSILTALPQSR